MKLSSYIILGFCLILGIGTGFALYHLDEQVKPRYREGIEDTLVETATMLATVVSQNPEDIGTLDALTKATQQKLHAQIYQIKKTNVDLRIYVTDATGIVRYHSKDPAEVGKDYSKWRDVALTLQGRYGARTTRDDPADPDSTVLYVGAPILRGDTITGVLTVCKPQRTTHRFVDRTKNTIITEALLGSVFLLCVGWIVSLVISRPIRTLQLYAQRVTVGENPTLPESLVTEVNELGYAFELMRKTIEGKKYIEEYIQHLTHELKSPTAAIRGAAELLMEDLPVKERAKFIRNILGESKRLEEILSRLLELASLEHNSVVKKEEISLPDLINDSITQVAGLAEERNIKILKQQIPTCIFFGDSFLLKQAVTNLLNNAVSFSMPEQLVTIACKEQAGELSIKIIDEGSGIPEYAVPRVGEKFYSLPRPDTGKKGTGLGVAFTRRVAVLHGGGLTYSQNKPKGTVAELVIRVV